MTDNRTEIPWNQWEENDETGDPSLDNPRNQDGIGEKELLIVSFGTSYNDSRRRNIGGIEEALERQFPDWCVRRAFTSQMIIDHIRSRDGIAIDNVRQALERAQASGVKQLVIQPTHLMNGLEYMELEREARAWANRFEAMAIGAPLLTADQDFQQVMEAVTRTAEACRDEETAVCLMGHGTEAQANQVYTKFQELLHRSGYSHYYVGTVEARPSIEEVLEGVRAGNWSRALLMPLMIVAGDHANNDMAGEEEGTWKRILEDQGCQVTCLMKGLGELEAVQNIFAAHARTAMDSLLP